MKNQLKQVENNLRYIAKRNKNITYSIGLVLMYLMLGINAFSEEVTPKVESQVASKQEISTSTDRLSEVLRDIKAENDKKLKGAQLELIQLMEQGDQVVKSPWASWQFGINFMYNNWSGSYKGRGDKKEKYPYEGVFVRGDWWERSVSPDSLTYSRLTKGNSIISSSTNRRDGYNYGLVNTKKIEDKGYSYIIEPVINISKPQVPSINVPGLPNLNINPVLTAPNINFLIPNVPTITFETIPMEDINVKVFNPPLLNDNSVAFSQGREVGINIHQNYIVSNSTVTLNKATTVSIDDAGYEGEGQYIWDGHSDDRGSGTIAGFPNNRPDSAKGITTGNNIDARRSNDNVSVYTSPYTDYFNSDREVTNKPRKFRANPNGLPATSQQVFMNNVTDGFDLKSIGDYALTFKNMTSNPKSHNGWVINPTNTIRVISVNHAYGTREKTSTSFINTDIKIYGRDGYFDKMTENDKLTDRAHMTVGVEHQAYGSLGARAINNKTMILEKESAKDSNKLGSHLIGMTAMIEDYGDYGIQTRGDDNANEGIPKEWYLGGIINKDSDGNESVEWKRRRQAPWESTMENRGSIIVNSIDSIGIDFARAYFRADLSKDKSTNTSGAVPNPKGNILAYNNKGSLNIYVAVGDIKLNGIDPENSGTPYENTVQGSYGLRVPNLFFEDTKHENNGITSYIYNHNDKYYDETVIDGKIAEGNEGIVVNGNHNVGVSISKIIKGSERVRKYQSGELGDETGNYPLSDDGKTKNGVNAKRHLIARNNTDPIGNIYNLNIKVSGKENIGFLRNSDYMYGNSALYSDQLTYKNDFKFDNTHIESIDFTDTAIGGVLFRTDKYGLDLAISDFKVTAMNDTTYNNNKEKFNIVMFANGSINGVTDGADIKDNLDSTKPVKVKNTNPITIGSLINTGYNMIGLMAYNGGILENNADITVNSKNSIVLVIQGEAERGTNKKISSGSTNNATIKILGEESVGVYNNEKDYTMTDGTLEIEGAKAVGVFSKGATANTKLINSKINIKGDSAIALYGNSGSDISLEGITSEVEANSVFFLADSSVDSNKSELKLIGDNNNVSVKADGVAFYLKENSLNNIREASTDGRINLKLEDNAVLSLIEGTGGNLPTNTTFNLNSFGATGIKGTYIAPGIFVDGNSGTYIPVKGIRTHFVLDKDINLDNKEDLYLNSEFSSSSITLESDKTISGSGLISSPIKLANKSKVGIAQKNTTIGVTREDVILTNNGDINLTGSSMVGIAGEFALIDNNKNIRTTGEDSVGIIVSNGGKATNNTAANITIGDGGVGIAGINYLGITENPSLSQPTTGKGFIEIVHKGSIVSNGTTKSAIGILSQDLEKNNKNEVVNATQASKITLDNKSIINVSSANGGIGVYSRGVYRNEVSKIEDEGAQITISKNGVGIYSNGTEIEATGGTIESIDKDTAKGIYTDSDVVNSKNIKLLGDKSIGIHNYGLNNLYPTDIERDFVKINNSGLITLGDSADINDPSIGIYTKYGEVSHEGTIEGGEKVVGIYSDIDKKVDLINGKIKLSNNGIAIYKKQGELNLDADSLLEVKDGAIVGYTDNNAKIVNNSKNIKIGNRSYGFVVMNNGTTYESDTDSKFTMGSKSVYLYKKGAGEVVSKTTVNAIGEENTAFFGENLVSIKNTGSLNLENGDKNTAFFIKNLSKVINSGVVNLGNKNKNTAFYLSDKSSADNSATLDLQNGENNTAFYVDNESKGQNTGFINLRNAKKSTAFYVNNKSEIINKGEIGLNNTETMASMNVAFYAENDSKITNFGEVNLKNGIGNIGAYAANNSTINNLNKISISGSDIINKNYSIGMAAQSGGKILNGNGATIEVTENYGVGMFAEGAGSRAENNGTIKLESTGELKGAYGMYLDNKAYGVNNGIIQSGNYSSDSNKESLIGVAVMNGATLENNGVIDIDARNSIGVYIKDAIIKNYGEIKISGANSFGIKNKNGTTDGNTELSHSNAGTIDATNNAKAFTDIPNIENDKKIEAGSTKISETGVVTIEDKVINIHDLTPGPLPIETPNFAFSNVGIYVDTLGRTKPINWKDGFDPSVNNDLIIGVEATELSNHKALKIGTDIMVPFINPYKNLSGTSSSILNAISSSLTWTAKPLSGASGYPEEVILAKIPYTDFVDKTDNAWNFTDGLEQRYDKNSLDSKEKKLFNKLNLIGKNEQVLLTQAFDEMMGHQYANVQQRIHSTGQILDKEFDYLKDEWRTASKDSNKVKVFGMKGEYSTDTAGVIDYKNNAYGVAYVGENETVKLGNTTGWYTGLVHNTFKFKDIGSSKEEMLQAKLGLFNSKAFDDNNSLNWTISGEAFVGYNKMHRKFLVVDEIFNARSRYWSYGVALKNELSKTFRLSEDFSLRGYGSIKAEYGRFQKIKEKSGEVRLEVKANDYISIKPEIGGELIYKTPLSGRNFFNAKLGVAYENELGRVGDAKNKARVAHTTADWFNIRGEKEDRKGNVKTDLSLGWDNEAYGITANIGYDTKGKNRRAGLGLRIIF